MKKVLSLIICVILVMSLTVSALAFSNVAVKSIKLDSTAVTLNVGQTFSLKVTLVPANTTQKVLVYSTSNKNVATVDSKGKITAVSGGKAIITVKSFSNKKVSAACNVTVKAFKPVTLKFIGPSFEKGFANGVQNDPVAKELVKKTGVTIDWVCGNNISDWNAYQNTLLASDDLPDIMYIGNNDSNFRTKVLSARAAIQLDNLLKTNGQDILKNGGVAVNNTKEFKSNDGNLYFLPLSALGDGRSPYSIGFVPYIRWDLYKAVGAPKVKTFNDLLPVLKQMQDKYPTTSDGKKAYAMGGFFGDWGNCMPRMMMQTFYDMYAMAGYYYEGHNVDKIHESYGKDSIFFTSAQFYNKGYQMGILDPECVTLKWEQYQEKINAGRIYFSFTDWSSTSYNTEAAKAGTPEKGFEPVWFDGQDNKPLTLFGKDVSGGVNVWITKHCKTPERAIDFFNYLWTYEGTELVMNGIQGKDYTMVDGKPVLTKATVDGQKNDPDYAIKSGIGKYHNISGLDRSCMDPKGYPVWFKNADSEVIKSLTSVDKDYDAYYKLQFPTQKYYNLKNASFNIGYNSLVSLGDDKEVAAISSKVNEYVNNNYGRLICAKTDADFNAEVDKWIADYKAMGIDKVYAAGKASYQEVRKKLGK